VHIDQPPCKFCSSSSDLLDRADHVILAVLMHASTTNQPHGNQSCFDLSLHLHLYTVRPRVPNADSQIDPFGTLLPIPFDGRARPQIPSSSDEEDVACRRRGETYRMGERMRTFIAGLSASNWGRRTVSNPRTRSAKNETQPQRPRAHPKRFQDPRIDYPHHSPYGQLPPDFERAPTSTSVLSLYRFPRVGRG
jgi:hypothetical protein